MICNVYSFDEKKESIHIALCGMCSSYLFIMFIYHVLKILLILLLYYIT